METLGNLGEFIGSIAVVASLLYLATQMRQNSEIVRTSVRFPQASWPST
jgi:hypothetical protein